MNLPDLLRREYFLNRFSWHAQDYPGYVGVKRDLRRELDATAAETGMTDAVTSLGDPRRLASDYLANLERPYPRWNSGAWWGGAGLWIITGLGIAYAIGASDGLAATGGGTLTTTVFGTAVTFVHTASEISAQFTFTWASLAWFLAATLVPYAIGARVWRARPARVPVG